VTSSSFAALPLHITRHVSRKSAAVNLPPISHEDPSVRNGWMESSQLKCDIWIYPFREILDDIVSVESCVLDLVCQVFEDFKEDHAASKGV